MVGTAHRSPESQRAHLPGGRVLAIVLGRAGSKGLPGKNVLPVAGRPMIDWTLDHALNAKRVDRVIVSTDGEDIAAVARQRGVPVIERPADLAHDTATVDAAARHAMTTFEPQDDGDRFTHIVILYANVPVRPADLVNRAVAKLLETGCDSVQSVAPVGKAHPWWMKQLDGDRLLPYVENTVYRRQDLPAVYQLDGGIIAVRRKALLTVRDGEPHAFLGTDRRAVVTESGAVVDVDGATDAAVAEARLRSERVRNTGGRITIGDRAVGDGEPVYIIAEIGVNHDGDPERALTLARAAAEAGADAIKLQLFDPDQLLSDEAVFAEYQQGQDTDPRTMLRRLQLPMDAMSAVGDLARELNLGFIVTPFSLESLDDMQRLDVDAVKIASPDAVNLPLIETMRGLDRPMIVSTGTCALSELGPTRSLLLGHPTAWLHCVSRYPTPVASARLDRITTLREALADGMVGLSDHTHHEMAGALAAGLGARLIEKHLTHDRTAPGPDHAASFQPEELATYIRHIRDAELLCGLGAAEADDQHEIRSISRQSVCTVRDLPTGHVLRRADLTLKRPGTGIPAARLDRLVGRRLSRAVAGNCPLKEEDLAPSPMR